METLLIELTKEQEEQLFPLFEELKDCGAVFAQLYIDGVMRVRLFTPEIAANVEQVLGSPECGFAPSAYGREVHKEKKNVVQQRDELLAVLQFILRGMDGGHIKCAPYFDFDPDAANIEFKHPAEMIRAAIAKATA